jgi:hypothetical protein
VPPAEAHAGSKAQFALFGHRRGEACPRANTASHALKDQLSDARVGGDVEDGASLRSDLAPFIDGTEAQEHALRALACGLRGRFEELEGRGRVGADEQLGGGEVCALDLGNVALRRRVKDMLRVHAHAEARTHATRAARTLDGGGLRDSHRVEAREARPRRMFEHPGEARVHHGGHRGNRERRLRDVRREDHLAALASAHGAILFVRGEVTVERHEVHAEGLSEFLGGLHGAADFACAGKEHEDVTRGRRFRPGPHEDLANAGDNLGLEGPIALGFLVLHGHGVRAASDMEHLHPEERGDGRRIDGGTHDEDFEIAPGALTKGAHPGEGQVTVEVALVELVKDHRAHALERGIAGKPPEQNALGHKSHPRAIARPVLKAHGVANLAADGRAELFRHANGRHARGEATRFHDPHLAVVPVAPAGSEQRRGNACGLAGAGFRHQHHAAVLRHEGEELIEARIDG